MRNGFACAGRIAQARSAPMCRMSQFHSLVRRSRNMMAHGCVSHHHDKAIFRRRCGNIDMPLRRD